MISEMDLYDAMHPRCRQAIREAPFDFRLIGMPKTAMNWAVGNPDRPSPGRFMAWLNAEIEAVRAREWAEAAAEVESRHAKTG